VLVEAPQQGTVVRVLPHVAGELELLLLLLLLAL
jgi:hypothetical protein